MYDPFFEFEVPGINSLSMDGLGMSATLRANMPASYARYNLAMLDNYQNPNTRNTRNPDIIDVLPGEDGSPVQDDGLEIDQQTGKAVSKKTKSQVDLSRISGGVTSKGLLIAGVLLLIVGLFLLK